MTFRRKGDKTRYSFVDADCIGRTCFQPGMYQHRSPMSCGGSRNTGSPDTPTCMQRAYRGCPEGPCGERVEMEDEQVVTHVGLPMPDKELVRKRREDGWKVV
jgi:hypothetical protein